jgi:hypothetical protein
MWFSSVSGASSLVYVFVDEAFLVLEVAIKITSS